MQKELMLDLFQLAEVIFFNKWSQHFWKPFRTIWDGLTWEFHRGNCLWFIFLSCVHLIKKQTNQIWSYYLSSRLLSDWKGTTLATQRRTVAKYRSASTKPWLHCGSHLIGRGPPEVKAGCQILSVAEMTSGRQHRRPRERSRSHNDSLQLIGSEG